MIKNGLKKKGGGKKRGKKKERRQRERRERGKRGEKGRNGEKKGKNGEMGGNEGDGDLGLQKMGQKVVMWGCGRDGFLLGGGEGGGWTPRLQFGSRNGDFGAANGSILG